MHPETAKRRNAGEPFCITTAKRSPLWISSQCRPSPLACCIASSSLLMIVGVSCTSMSPGIQPVSGQLSNSEMPSYADVPRFVVFDHDAKYGLEVPATIRAMSISPLRSSIACPWQNGVAERWVGSCRRELLDHVIPLNERHLMRLLLQYVSYYHDNRTHLALQKQTPGRRKPCVAAAR